MLKVFSASSDDVVASIGTLNFCTEANDSPSLVRRLEATLPKAFTTSSLLDASACSLASVSPLPQFTASSPTTYWLPSREIEPASMALLPVRKQISCANSRVTRSLGARPTTPPSSQPMTRIGLQQLFRSKRALAAAR